MQSNKPRSCILLFLSIDNIAKGLGPKSRHARERDSLETGSASDSKEKVIDEPERAHTSPGRTDERPYIAPAAEHEPVQAGR